MPKKNKSTVVLILFLISIIPSCRSVDYEDLKTKALEQYPPDKPYPESEFMYVNGAKLHVRQWFAKNTDGDTCKGVVFLIHGVSGSTYNWRFLAPALALDGWNVLGADLPPFGFSGERQQNSLALDPLLADSSSRADLLWDLFDAVFEGYSDPIVLIGHSLGGRIVSNMALSKPERVSKLVLIAPAVYGKSAIPTITKYWPFNRIVIPAARLALTNIQVVQFVAEKAYGKKLSEDDFIGNLAPFLREGVPEAYGEWAIKSIESEAPKLCQITEPTLILWGKKDAIVPNKGVLLQKEINNSQYIEIPGKSHCIMDTDYKIVNSRIITFIN